MKPLAVYLQVFQSLKLWEWQVFNIWPCTQWTVHRVSGQETVLNAYCHGLTASESTIGILRVRFYADALTTVGERCHVGNLGVSNSIGIAQKIASITNNLRLNRRTCRHSCSYCAAIVFGSLRSAGNHNRCDGNDSNNLLHLSSFGIRRNATTLVVTPNSVIVQVEKIVG